MASFQRPNRLFLLVIFCLSTVLAACSSGGGGKGGPAPGTGDTRPDNFTITTPSGVDPTKVAFNAPIVSAPVTIAGIDTAAPVSISGGQFSIDGGTFTSTASTVRNGQTITVRVQSPVKAGQTVTATLSVGGFAAPFTVTTQADTTPPEVAILFPPPASMTEGETLFVRGTVRDVHGTLKATGAVLVNGVAATLERNGAGDEAEWQAEVNLVDGLNAVSVVATDAENNVTNDVEIEATKALITSAFPNSDVPLMDPVGIIYSVEEGRPSMFLTDPTAKAVVAVDLNSGTRNTLSDNSSQSDNAFDRPWRLTKGSGSVIFVTDRREGAIYSVDARTGARTRVPLQNASDELSAPTGISYSQSKQRLYVAHGIFIYEVDPLSGAVASITGASDSSEQSIFSDVYDLVVDETEARVFGVDYGAGRVLSINLASNSVQLLTAGDLIYLESITVDSHSGTIYAVDATNARVLRLTADSDSLSFAQINDPAIENSLAEPWGVTAIPGSDVLLVADRRLKGVVALDVESGRQVIISKSESE